MKLDDLCYWIVRTLAWILTHLICRYRVNGREHIPTSGPLLVVANHLSWYDPFLFATLFPRRLWFYTKAEVFTWPVVGWFAHFTGQIPVNRGVGDRVALQQALTYVREGKALVIFPEGTVERQERMIPAHTGVAMIAMRSGATILPVAHWGTRRVLRKGWLPRVHVEIGTPYVPSLPEGMARKARLQVVTDDAMGRIAIMLPAEERGVYI